LKIDSLKVKIEDIINFDENNFFECKSINQTYFKLKNKSLGLNDITIFDNGTAIIEISSKILKEKYLNGITADNINIILEQLSQYIKFNIENITVLKLDIFKHIATENKADFLNQLKVLNRTGKYKLVEFYDNESAVFEKDNKTNGLKDRIIFYDKQAELENSLQQEQDEEKKEIIFKIISSKEFKNLIRIELNITKFARARQLLNVSDNKLMTVLSSQENVIDNLIEKYFNKKDKIKMEVGEERQVLYYCYLIEKSLLNIELIKEQIKKEFKTKYLIEKEMQYFEKAKEKIREDYKIKNFNVLEQLSNTK
jgi:predicted transposase YbfD/YdcC